MRDGTTINVQVDAVGTATQQSLEVVPSIAGGKKIEEIFSFLLCAKKTGFYNHHLTKAHHRVSAGRCSAQSQTRRKKWTRCSLGPPPSGEHTIAEHFQTNKEKKGKRKLARCVR